ncbi:MAG: IPT/TIG domain-containing protein [Cyclobacteriaceae bacterium]
MKRTLSIKVRLLSILVFLLVSAGSYSQTPSFEWAAAFGGTGNDAGFSIAPDASGNVFTTGKFSGTADFDPGPGTFNLTSAGSEDIFVSKLDASGNFVWAYGFGGASLDQGRSIAVDPSGNIVITGYFRNTIDFDPGPGILNLTAASGLFDVFILKLDGDGNFLWAVSFGDPASNSDVGYSVATDDTGNIYATGTFSGTADFDPGAGTFSLSAFSGGGFTDVFILKLDESGNFVWAKSIGGTSSDIAFTLAVDLSNNVIIGGHFYGTIDFDPGVGVNNITSSGPKNLFILKLDTNGDFVWAKNLVSSFSDFLLGVATDVNDNVFVTGEFYTSIDLDPGPGNYFQTEVAAGDIFILKLDATGSFLWGAGIGGNQEDSGRSVAVDAAGNSYFTGHYAGTVDFDPGPGVFNLSSTTSNTYDIFISKYDPSGNFVWAGSMGGTSDFEVGNAISLDAVGSIYLTGDFYNMADFDPGSGVFNLSGSGTAVDAFVVKLASVSATPIITSFTPNSGPVGTSVTITGTNFSTTQSNNLVKFNGTTAVVTASTATSITTAVPAGATTGKISVTVGGNTATSATDFTILSAGLPTITSFTPAAGSIGTTVTITGTNFSATPSNNMVMFNGATAIVTASTATSITTTVPAGATTGKISVTVAGNTATSANDFTILTTVLHTITNFSPASGLIGATVSITGTNFSTVPSENTVMFNGTTATVLASTANSITTTVPLGATSGKITVTLAGNTATSATDFIITTISNQPPVINTTEATVPISGSTSIDLTLLISDSDNNLDLTTLKIVSHPSSAAFAQIIDNLLIIDYKGLNFSGQDRITIEVCDLLGSCTQQELTINVVGDLVVYTGISPNGDLFNQKWIIQNIESLPDTKENKVSIYNRWGDLVFETENYDNEESVFIGSNMHGTKVPSGIYFYKIEFLSGKKPLLGYMNVKH